MPFAAVLSILKGLIIVSVGTMRLFLHEDNPFKTEKGLVDYSSDTLLACGFISLEVVNCICSHSLVNSSRSSPKSKSVNFFYCQMILKCNGPVAFVII